MDGGGGGGRGGGRSHRRGRLVVAGGAAPLARQGADRQQHEQQQVQQQWPQRVQPALHAAAGQRRTHLGYRQHIRLVARFELLFRVLVE